MARGRGQTEPAGSDGLRKISIREPLSPTENESAHNSKPAFLACVRTNRYRARREYHRVNSAAEARRRTLVAAPSMVPHSLYLELATGKLVEPIEGV
jgi:hypothetical protein